MMKIKDFTQLIEAIAPPAYQESYDNAGLIVGDFEMQVTGILLCLDATEEVILEAERLGCNLVIAHHPIVFSGLKRLNGSNYVERAVLQAVRKDIAIYAAHTNLDNVFARGVNSKMAEKLGLSHGRILSPKRGLLSKLVVFVPKKDAETLAQALFQAGAGQIGNYTEASFRTEGLGTFRPMLGANPHLGVVGQSETVEEIRLEVVFPRYLQGAVLKAMHRAHPYEEVAYDVLALENENPYVGSGWMGELLEPMPMMDFLRKVKAAFGTGCLKYTQSDKVLVHRVALCGGAGSFLLKQAKAAGADVFISGDFKYHEFFDAEGQITVVDIGHYESERYTMEIFYEVIREKFPNFAVYLTDTNTNPVAYL